jgi:hypothetical protein
VELVVSTNLPSGSRVVYVWTDGPTRGYAVAPAVAAGRTTLEIGHSACSGPEPQSTPTFDLTVIAAPSVNSDLFTSLYKKGYLERPMTIHGDLVQPDSTMKLLGDHFQKLTGSQVVNLGTEQVLLASQVLTWPHAEC